MESLNDQMKRVEAQEIISRFRSKEDLYRYLTLHVGLFLPTMEGTKISFLKAILCEEKKAFKNKDIKLIEIPNYPEISVTNLYEDAMQDKEEVVYLPTKKQLSNKLPERNFFFGVLEEARHFNKLSLARGTQEASLSFNQALTYNFVGKSGTGIYLMKEHAKVHRERKSQTIHEVSKRLYKDVQKKPDEMNIDAGAGTKRRNMGPNKPQEEEKKKKPNPFMGQFNM